LKSLDEENVYAGCTPKVFAIEQDTRWNWILKIIETNANKLAQDASKSCSGFLPADSPGTNLPDDAGYESVRRSTDIWNSLRHFTKVMESESIPTFSFVFPQLLALMTQYGQLLEEEDQTPTNKAIARLVLESFDDRFSKNFFRRAGLVALALDPRFKNGLTIPEGLAGQMKQELKIVAKHEEKLMANQNAQKKGPEVQKNSTVVKYARFSNFANFARSSQAQPAPPIDSLTLDQEIERYFSAPGQYIQDGLPDESACPLQWWKMNRLLYPTLARCARKYLGIPGSSASAERLFSFCCARVGVKTNNLGTYSLLMKVMVAKCQRLCKQYGYELVP